MSNGDDVLDNWEEIDEAGINSSVQKLKNSSTSTTCERITEPSLQNSDTVTSSTKSANNIAKPIQMKLLQRSNTQDSTTTTTSASKPSPKSPLDDMSATFEPVMMVLHKPQDEYHSANYAPPIANQTVKILRRPTQTTEPRNNGRRPKLPLKTLQQREQEYAEARLRILGSAKNPEDDEQKTTTIATTTTVQTPLINSTQSTPTVATTAISNPFTTLSPSNTKINSPKIPAGPNQYNNHYNQQMQSQQQQQQQYQQNYQSQQQPQPQSYFYNQQLPQSPAYSNNNNRTYSLNPLLGLGPMGAIGQPAQYQAATILPSSQAQQQPPQQHLKYQQFHQKSSHLQHKQQQQQQQTWSPVVGGSVSSSSLRQQPPNDTILRLPRGPDGTTGFQIRR